MHINSFLKYLFLCQYFCIFFIKKSMFVQNNKVKKINICTRLTKIWSVNFFLMIQGIFVLLSGATDLSCRLKMLLRWWNFNSKIVRKKPQITFVPSSISSLVNLLMNHLFFFKQWNVYVKVSCLRYNIFLKKTVK